MNIVKFIRESDDVIIGKGCAKSVITEYEKKLGLKFSAEYKMYLESFGMVAYNGHEISGIGVVKRLDVLGLTSSYKSLYDVPNEFYVVEDAGIDGIVIWQSDGGKIYQTSPGQQYEKIANSLLEYLQKY